MAIMPEYSATRLVNELPIASAFCVLSSAAADSTGTNALRWESMMVAVRNIGSALAVMSALMDELTPNLDAKTIWKARLATAFNATNDDTNSEDLTSFVPAESSIYHQTLTKSEGLTPLSC
jgi:hypothetical protein